MNPIMENVAKLRRHYSDKRKTSYDKWDFSKLVKKIIGNMTRNTVATPIEKIYEKFKIKLVELDMKEFGSDDEILGFVIAKNENFQVETGESTVVAGVNKTDTLARKRFSAAHEFYHAIFDLKDRMKVAQNKKFVSSVRILGAENCPVQGENEKKANEFAAQLLMPTKSVTKAYKKTKSVEELASMFGVSVGNMRIRLSNLGLLEKFDHPNFSLV
ncbi:MAG: ImmA/IrrE family metallo-endopeptidase [Defluviitaleaceae bacterium]|nr:ImmA/IrrE family metallo-endopeptidase [Defluviitaleaceae bacterium]